MKKGEEGDEEEESVPKIEMPFTQPSPSPSQATHAKTLARLRESAARFQAKGEAAEPPVKEELAEQSETSSAMEIVNRPNP